MTRLGALADEMTPVLNDLAPSRRRSTADHPARPVLAGGDPGGETLGEAAKVGTPAVIAARPVIAKLRKLARSQARRRERSPTCSSPSSAPTASSALMDYVYYQVAAINGFDSSATTCAPA